MHDIIIDPEFKSLIPPLAEEELAQLEQNILAEGCRDPLVVWFVPAPESGAHKCYDEGSLHGGDNCELQVGDGVWTCRYCEHNPARLEVILLDGHNRYEICTRHGIEFDTVDIELPDRESARDWIDANQLGRRNLSPDAFKLLLGRRYNRTKKARGAPIGNNNRTKQMVQSEPIVSTAETLAVEHGVSPATVKRAAKYAEEVERTPELQQAIAERRPVIQVKRELKERQREERRQENRVKVSQARTPAAVNARFATIVIDPPWDWGDEGDQDQLGRARPDYATMGIDQLEALPVGELADDDCHLYLWITNRSLPKGFALMEAWGFRYVTCLTWVKPHFGMGNYFRGQTEQVLFGVRGSQPLKRRDAGTVLHAPRGRGGHSSKPLEFIDLVESCSPGPYLEMFSRTERPDWFAWGENSAAA